MSTAVRIVGQITEPTTGEIIAGRCHSAQFQPTERPIEDRFSFDFDIHSNRIILGVYDGHGGSATAEYISKSLPARLLRHTPTEHAYHFEQLDNEILLNFQKDHSLFHSRSSEWIHNAQLVKSGCTALVFDLDLTTLSATFSNAGDGRLVICTSNPDRGRLLLQTQDLNAKTPSERERIRREHPKEDQVIIGDRLFGRLMSTRGFGDGYYKLPKRLLSNGPHHKYIDVLSSIEPPGKIPMNAQYTSLFYGYRTPPYIVATPEVGTFQLANGDIAILATDGLWDLVSSEAAVDIVLRAVASGETNLAKYLLEQVMHETSPGDDVTILTFTA